MFWRKKKTLSNYIQFDTDDRRESYRVEPLSDQPILISHGENHKIPLVDIGSMGASFASKDFKKGDSFKTSFTLPGMNRGITALVVVLRVDRENICRCRFSELEASDQELIHKYMLELQKKKIRLDKKK